MPFAQLQHSANLLMRTYPRKDEIRIQNANHNRFTNAVILHFPGWLTESVACLLLGIYRRSGND